jgi:hypothetical protein
MIQIHLSRIRHRVLILLRLSLLMGLELVLFQKQSLSGNGAPATHEVITGVTIEGFPSTTSGGYVLWF